MPDSGRLRKRHLSLILVLVAAGLVLLGIPAAWLLPQWLLVTPGMERHDSSHFTVWAEAGDRRAAIELRTMLEDRGGQAVDFLGLAGFPAGPHEVFLYRDRLSFAIHRDGLWAAWIDRAGVVAERRGGRILAVSPGNPGLSHSSDSVYLAVAAAWIRPLVEGLAAPSGPWLREGLVLWLAGASRDDEDLTGLPERDVTHEEEYGTWLVDGGERYADAFVSWLMWRFGPDAVRKLWRTGDWADITDMEGTALSDAWRAWMRAGRPGDPRLDPALPPEDRPDRFTSVPDAP